MSERPNALLGLLLALAVAVLGGVAASLIELAQCDVGGLAMRVVASLSACVVFFHHARSVSLGALVLALVTSASLLALSRELRRVLVEQRLLRRLPLLPATDEVRAALDIRRCERVFVLPGSRPLAFCFGLLRPRVVISVPLLDRLERQEQAAVLWHELAHARRREPLRCLLARLATTALFWLPALRDLRDRYLLAKELAADRLALEKTSRQALAAALWGVLDQPGPLGAVGLSEGGPARIERLLDPKAPLPPLFDRRRLIATILAAASLLLLAVVPADVDVTRLDRLHHLAVAVAHATAVFFG